LNSDLVYEEIRKIIETGGHKRRLHPHIFFVIGGPGSGKKTQCQHLVKNLGMLYVNADDLVEEEVKLKGEYQRAIEAA